MMRQGQGFGLRTRARRVILMAILAPLAACGSKDGAQAPPPAPVTVVQVEPSAMPLSIEYVGETAGFREVEVRARVSGILLKRTYTEGEAVKAGQVLFEIDPAPYQAALEQVRGGLAQAQAALNKAKADRDRMVPLFAKHVVSRRDYDDTIAAYDAAVANAQSARARVKEAELNLDYTHVTAPIAGVTSKGTQSEGSLVVAGSQSGLLTTISQLDPMYVNFAYPEQDRLNLERLQHDGTLDDDGDNDWPVRLRLSDGSLYAKVGHVNFSDNRIDTRTGTIRARAIFDNPDERLLPGQFVRLILELGQLKDVLQVPQRAIVQAQADKMVMVVGAGDMIEPRTVTLGYTSNGMVLVKDGLKAGERVVVEGLLKARPGTKVAPSLATHAAPAAPAAK